MTLCLGKKPARPEAQLLKLSMYLRAEALPTPPSTFGWDNLVTSWPMLANDSVGDCAIAGSLHETQLWNAAAKKTIPLDDACALKNYASVTGFTPVDPDGNPWPDGENPTDQGTDVADLMKYRQQTGLVDADGGVHKIAAALALEPGNLHQLAAAVWIFGAVGVGFQLPAFAQDDFSAEKVWAPQSADSTIEGGHYVSFVGLGDYWHGVTWGGVAQITDGFVSKYCDEAWVCLSEEMLTNGVNLDGFAQAQLVDDLKQLAA